MYSAIPSLPMTAPKSRSYVDQYRRLILTILCLFCWAAWADEAAKEIHDQLRMPVQKQVVALTLDACSGRYDGSLIDFLIAHRIPATLFVTKKWLEKNPAGLATIKAHLDLFDVEDHGENHIPAVIGLNRKVYGIAGEPDIVHLRKEVVAGAEAVEAATGVAPRWYRGATAEYDDAAVEEIQKLGYRIAGFSVNADAGATLKKQAIEERLRNIKSGDIIIAHMNKPSSDTAEGLAVALTRLLQKGFTFVRLDEVDVEPVMDSLGNQKAATKTSR
jgi:peptidoglycan/xylan/chitin deacetylase (PgdA/CDA1 family)